jgi:hypothetical protein
VAELTFLVRDEAWTGGASGSADVRGSLTFESTLD